MKNKILNREPVLGTMLSEIATPNILRVLHSGGLDFVIIDAEHGPFDFSQLANLVAVGNLIGLTTLIRIPEIRREWITKILDMGADGMLVPMVNTPEEARQIVEYAKYTPLGNRGVSTTRAHTNYNPGKLADYFVSANDRTIILCQIETPEAVKNARAIASVEGVDALIVGPSDLSTTHGFAGDASGPEMTAIIESVIAEAKAAGKATGFVHSKPAVLKAWQEKGMTIFSCGSELNMLKNGAKKNRQEFFG